MNELKELISSINFNEPYSVNDHREIYLDGHVDMLASSTRPGPPSLIFHAARIILSPSFIIGQIPQLLDLLAVIETFRRFAALKSDKALELQTHYEGEKTHGRQEDIRLLAPHEVRTLRRFLDKQDTQRWEYIVLVRNLIQLYIHYLWTAPELYLLPKIINDFFPGSMLGIDEPSESLFHIDLSEDEREYFVRLKVESQGWMKLAVDWETKQDETCKGEGLSQEDTDKVLLEGFRAMFPQPSIPSKMARDVEIYMNKVEGMVRDLQEWFPAVGQLCATHITTPPRLWSLSSPVVKQADLLDNLGQFTDAVWGNPRALLKQLPSRDIEFIDLGKYFNTFTVLSAGILQHDKILVRDEYRTALRELQTERYERGAYVTGQPGIGKTYFLIYALVQFLGQKQPVALELGSEPFYVLFKDTVALYPLTNRVPLYECTFVWALSDSNANLKTPAPIFMGDPRRVRIIQATSPKASRWKEWSKQMGASCYIMDIWSDEEILNLAMLFGKDVGRMTTLAKKWGNIPRGLLRYISEEDGNIEHWYRAGANTAIQNCSTILAGGVLLDLPLLSSFYFIQPMKTDTGSICHRLPTISVPTPTLRHFLAEALQVQTNITKLQFYNALSQYGQTRKAAGCIYENWFHCFFSAGREIRCHWIQCSSDNDTLGLPTVLQGSQTLVPSANNELKSQRPSYYWPASTNFPGIDSVLVLEKEIFVFQVTIRASHESPIKGLQKLRTLLPSHLRDLPWRVVFIGAEEAPVEEVAKQWSHNLYFPTKDAHVPVAWSVVNPVQTDITYEEHRDLADPVPEDLMMGRGDDVTGSSSSAAMPVEV